MLAHFFASILSQCYHISSLSFYNGATTFLCFLFIMVLAHFVQWLCYTLSLCLIISSIPSRPLSLLTGEGKMVYLIRKLSAAGRCGDQSKHTSSPPLTRYQHFRTEKITHNHPWTFCGGESKHTSSSPLTRNHHFRTRKNNTQPSLNILWRREQTHFVFSSHKKSPF